MSELRDKMLEGFVPNVFNPREMILFSESGAPLAGVTLWHKPERVWGPNYIHLEDLRALTRGGGRKVMELLAERADQYGAILSGTAEPMKPTPGGGKKLSKKKLLRWYVDFGFQIEDIASGDVVRYPKKTMEPVK